MNVGETPVNVYVNVSKAYDTLIYSTLHKIKHGLTYTSIKSYLESRTQFVEFKKECSETKHIKNGVPQGSILGPFLFLIYINNIPNVSNIVSKLSCVYR